jgi:preprotein translocase subunit YajC
MFPQLVVSVLAQQRAPAEGPQSVVPTVVMFGLLAGIIYFLILRPQKRVEQERQDMQARVKKNDHVVTQGGLKGIVTSVKDDEVTLKVDEQNNVRIRFTRSSIVAVIGEGEEKSGDSETKKPS